MYQENENGIYPNMYNPRLFYHSTKLLYYSVHPSWVTVKVKHAWGETFFIFFIIDFEKLLLRFGNILSEQVRISF